MSKVSIVSGLFLVGKVVNLHKCVCPLNSLLNRKTVVFTNKIANVNNLKNRSFNHGKENFGKSVHVSSDNEKGSEFLII